MDVVGVSVHRLIEQDADAAPAQVVGWRARVISNPSSAGDAVLVTIGGIDGGVAAWTVAWRARVSDAGVVQYPAVGAVGLVVFDDDSEPWLTEWTGAHTDGAGGAGGGGSSATTVVSVNTNTTISAADTVVLVTGGVTVTLPASPTAGEWHDVKDAAGTAAASPITLAAGGTALIDGASSVQIGTPWQSLHVISNGTDWFIT